LLGAERKIEDEEVVLLFGCRENSFGAPSALVDEHTHSSLLRYRTQNLYNFLQVGIS
jgi:hypothetical protein